MLAHQFDDYFDEFYVTHNCNFNAMFISHEEFEELLYDLSLRSITFGDSVYFMYKGVCVSEYNANEVKYKLCYFEKIPECYLNHTSDKSKFKKECTCSGYDLLNFGCKCGSKRK